MGGRGRLRVARTKGGRNFPCLFTVRRARQMPSTEGYPPLYRVRAPCTRHCWTVFLAVSGIFRRTVREAETPLAGDSREGFPRVDLHASRPLWRLRNGLPVETESSHARSGDHAVRLNTRQRACDPANSPSA